MDAGRMIRNITSHVRRGNVKPSFTLNIGFTLGFGWIDSKNLPGSMSVLLVTSSNHTHGILRNAWFAGSSFDEVACFLASITDDESLRLAALDVVLPVRHDASN
jgi:hypothetical protein